MLRAALSALPSVYFHPPPGKQPVAPVWHVLAGFVFEIGAAAVCFASLFWYFATSPTRTTTISSSIMQGHSCLALNPKRGTVYYSTSQSENAQFAIPSMTSEECEDLLKQLDVCGDGLRFDLINLWGVASPNVSHYFPGGGRGYLSFAPTQISGLSTKLAAFYGSTGLSVSFPKPVIDQTFTGTKWFLINLAKSIVADPAALQSFPGVSAPTLLYDSATSKVYDPDPTKQQKDYALSTSSPDASATDILGGMGAALGQLEMLSLGVHGGVYYGLQIGASFNIPSATAVDSAGTLFVADNGNNLVRRIDAVTGTVTNLGTSASPAFKAPAGVALDSSGNVFVADSGNNLIRRIDAVTGAVTSIGTTANPPYKTPFDVAVDNSGNVFVGDYLNHLVRRIDAVTGVVTSIGTSASPAYNRPVGVAVDGSGNVFVADWGNNQVRRIDASTGAVTSMGTSASPAFFCPQGVKVDNQGNLFVADTFNNLVRRIDAVTGTVTSLGTSANPPFFRPQGVAVDASGNVYVADQYNNQVRKIDAKTGIVARLGRLYQARVFSWDLKNPDPKSYTLWRSAALTTPDWTNNYNITVVDSAAGGCMNLQSGRDGKCFLLAHSEFNTKSVRLYLEFQIFQNSQYRGYNIFSILEVPPARAAIPNLWYIAGSSVPSRQLWAVFNTSTHGAVLFTSQGALSDYPDSHGNVVPLTDFKNFKGLVTATGTVIRDVSKIPGVNGSPTRFLLLLLQQTGGVYSMKIYDTFTDTVVTSNNAATAATHYMLAYTWGVCDGAVTRGLVEITFSNDYSNQCQFPSTGLYYQSENQYFGIPYSCLTIAPDKLLTDCPEIKANMKSLVGSTCAASIPKVCQQQYELNPPFSCITDVYPSTLTVLSLSFSNTIALASALAVIVAAVLGRMHKNYRPSQREMALANPSQDKDRARVALSRVEPVTVDDDGVSDSKEEEECSDDDAAPADGDVEMQIKEDKIRAASRNDHGPALIKLHQTRADLAETSAKLDEARLQLEAAKVELAATHKQHQLRLAMLERSVRSFRGGGGGRGRGLGAGSRQQPVKSSKTTSLTGETNI